MTTMTDSEALAVLTEFLDHAPSDLPGLEADASRAIAHIAEALRDAARYRWLMRRPLSVLRVKTEWGIPTFYFRTCEADDYIDAAMKDKE